MIISEKSLLKGIEVELSNNVHPTLPNRAIRFSLKPQGNQYELYNFETDEVDYANHNLADLVDDTNRLLGREDKVVHNISYHSETNPHYYDSYKKGGKVKTYRDKYNEKYGYAKGSSHSLKEISKKTGVSMKGLQKIYDKGVGARKTNPQSVRSLDGVKRGGKSLKGKMSAEQWAMGRVYSAVMGGKASKVDAKELKMEKGGLFVGKSHAEGGIPVKVKSTGQDIEVEGGEIIINKRNSASANKNTFNGKEMTNCEVLSEINEQGGNGVKIDCDSIEGKKYKMEKGGKTSELDEVFEDYFNKGGNVKMIVLEDSLGFDKKDLPQIRTKDKELFVQYLNDKYNRNMAKKYSVSATSLKPVQNKINPKQLEVIEKDGGLIKGKPITISNDGYVVDGHHRWYFSVKNNLEIPVIRIDLPAKELIAESFMSGLAEKDDIDSVRRAYAEGGKISGEFMRSQIPFNLYTSFVNDTDGDGIRDVDDVDPLNPNNSQRLEEVSVSDELREIVDYRNDFERVREEVVEDLEVILDECDSKGDCGILSRTKTPFSIINKLRRRSLTNTKDLDKLEQKAKKKLKDNDLTGLDLYKGLTDVVGTMVVTPDKRNADKVAKAINEGRVGEVLEFEDFYKEDNNGYRAYHFLVSVEKDGVKFPVEIQVKTRRVKKLGDLAHTLYKTGSLNAQEFNRLNLMALRADKGNERAIKQFDNLIKDEAKVMNMISTKKMARGGIMEFYDSYEPKDEKEREVLRYIPPYIPLTGKELSKIDFDFMFGNVNMLPSSTQTQYDDKDHQAYIRYYNDAGVNYFVTSGRKDEAWDDKLREYVPVIEMYGYYFDAEDEDSNGMSYRRSNQLLQDFGDEFLNFKLDYNFAPQTINGGLAVAGFREFQSRDVKPLGRAYQDMDIDTIVNTNYKSYVEKNNAIMNLISYFGSDINSYDIEAQNFIATYTCESFKNIRTNKLNKVLVGMVYQDILDKDIEINNCITFGDCCGKLSARFEPYVEILGIDNDDISRNVSEIISAEQNANFMDTSTLDVNPPDEQMDSSIIFAENLPDAITKYMTYVKPNGIIVLLCYVNDFEDYFSSEENQNEFLLRYNIENKYRISTENLLLHINKIQN
tara:strand:- start:1618 stop:4941 length:3324 start_codon:yes stop_codon:yes gene_type:complete